MKFTVISFQFLMSFILISTGCHTQGLHPLEAPEKHYIDLQTLSGMPSAERSDLDDIKFPTSSASSGSLIYALVSPVYLTHEEMTTLRSDLKFPANSSDQTRAELDYLLEWQAKRTEEQEDRAAKELAPIGYWPHISILKDHERYEKNLSDLFFEGRTVLGNEVTAAAYPLTSRLLEGVTRDMRVMEFFVKYYLLRPRPYHLEPRLDPLARISSPSFVSGHTLWAYIQAFVWSELVPQKRKEFLSLAYEVGESREIMGIHYPSDEEWARVLAHRMLEEMWDNDSFMNDLEEAKTEWE